MFGILCSYDEVLVNIHAHWNLVHDKMTCHQVRIQSFPKNVIYVRDLHYPCVAMQFTLEVSVQSLVPGFDSM